MFSWFRRSTKTRDLLVALYGNVQESQIKKARKEIEDQKFLMEHLNKDLRKSS